MGRSRIPGGVKNQYRVPFEKRTEQRKSQAASSTILKVANKTGVSGSGLTWGDNGDNITVAVAIAGGIGTKPQDFMGFMLWDTGYTVADLPSLRMRMTRVVSPTAATTGPPTMLYGIVMEDAVGNVDFTVSVSRWGGVCWAKAANGANNQCTNTLRGNQVPGYSGTLTTDASSPTNYGFEQHLQFLLRQNIANSAGSAGSYYGSSTYTSANYPGSNGNGTYFAAAKNETATGALTATDKIFWFIGIFRRTHAGSGTVNLEFKMVASALKGAL